MSISSSEVCRWVLLALVGAAGLGCRSAYECTGVDERQARPASGELQVLVRGTPVGGWLPAVTVQQSESGAYDVYVQACERPLASVDDSWRLNIRTALVGRVESAPVQVWVASPAAPSVAGTVVDVLNGVEYDFATGGSGHVLVRRFDPESRRFALEGEVFTAGGNRLQLRWDLSW